MCYDGVFSVPIFLLCKVCCFCCFGRRDFFFFLTQSPGSLVLAWSSEVFSAPRSVFTLQLSPAFDFPIYFSVGLGGFEEVLASLPLPHKHSEWHVLLLENTLQPPLPILGFDEGRRMCSPNPLVMLIETQRLLC